MRRQVRVQGPIEALDAVMAVGQEGLLDFDDYFRDRDSTYSALLVVFDDTIEAECDVLEQVRTLLAEKGADASAFRVTERYLSYPDALPHEWYQHVDREFGAPLLALEALGVRTEGQQREMDRLREEVAGWVADATEQAEANIAEFMQRMKRLLGE